MSAFMRLDFPTFDRPTNTISGRTSRNTFESWMDIDLRNWASEIFIEQAKINIRSASYWVSRKIQTKLLYSQKIASGKKICYTEISIFFRKKIMNELPHKIRANAASAYFLFFICIAFLWSKKPYMNHPFVKGHTKIAFLLQLLLIVAIFITQIPVLGTTSIFGYNVQDIITSMVALGIFWLMLIGAYNAHQGNTMKIGEIFSQGKQKTQHFKSVQTESETPEERETLILAQIPIIGYILAGRHPNIPHIKEITLMNLFAMLVCVLLLISGFPTLSSIALLLYIVFAVFQSLSLKQTGDLLLLDEANVPSPEKLLLYMHAFWASLVASIKKEAFIPFETRVATFSHKRYEQEKKAFNEVKARASANIPAWLFYIPLVNIFGIFFLKKREKYHIINGLVLTLLFIWVILLWGWRNHTLLLFLFPISYGIGYLERLGYHMPYIYDLYDIFARIGIRIKHIFSGARKLQKKQIHESIKISNTKTPQTEKKEEN